MRALLGKACIVDDPRLNRTVTLDLGQDQLAHFAEDHLVRPAPFADKMQKRLMLGGHPRRRRHGRNRLDALALTGQHQPRAIVAKRLRSILVPNHAHKSLDIRDKPRFTALQPLASHPQPSPLIRISPNT